MTYTDNEGVIRCSRCSLPLVPSESPFARPGQLDCPASGRDGWQHDSHIEDTTGSEP